MFRGRRFRKRFLNYVLELPAGSKIYALETCDNLGYHILGSYYFYPLIRDLELRGWLVGKFEELPGTHDRTGRRYYLLTDLGLNGITRELIRYR